MILSAHSTPTSAGVKNFRVICGYSMFEELHCGQRIRAAEMFGSVDSHSIIRLCAFSKSLSSTITLVFACRLDMLTNDGANASSLTAVMITESLDHPVIRG